MMQGATQTGADQMLALWNTVRHYRGWIFLGTVILTLGGVALIFAMPDHYKATTTILVDPQKVPEKYVSPTVSSDPGQRLNTITQQVLSSSRLQQIIDEMRLYPELRSRRSREEIVEMMKKDISISVKQGSSTGLSSFSIEYEGTHPVQVAQVANQLAASFIDWNVKNREQQSLNTAEFLQSQLKDAKQNLEEQEQKVSAFKMRHLGEMPEQQTANLQALSQLQAQFQANVEALNRLDVEKTLLLRGLEPAGATASKAVPVTERGRLEEEKRTLRARLADLQHRYTDAHPEVIDTAARLQQIDEQLRLLPPDPHDTTDSQSGSAESVRLQIVDRESRRLNDEQKRITAQIAGYRAKVDAVPVREQEMAELNRNYGVSKEHYQSLLDKTFSAEMAADLERKQQAEHFTILDAAQVPEKPFTPKRRMILPGAFLAALVVSVSLAWGKDVLDNALKTERELKGILPPNVVLLTSVPRITTGTDRRRSIRFVLIAALITIAGCALEFVLYLKLHPIL